jgi:hypothetical protein
LQHLQPALLRQRFAAQIDTGFEQVRGKAVTQQMNAAGLADAGLDLGALKTSRALSSLKGCPFLASSILRRIGTSWHHRTRAGRLGCPAKVFFSLSRFVVLHR